MSPTGDFLLRVLLPLVPALATGFLLDQATARRVRPDLPRPPGFESASRRLSMVAVLAVLFYLGVFLPLSWLGRMEAFDPEAVKVADLFLLHALLAAGLISWFSLGFGGRVAGGASTTAAAADEEAEPPPPRSAWRELASQCGLLPRHPAQEVVLGAVVAPLLWLAVILAMVLVGWLIGLLGPEGALPGEMPPAVAYLAGLPVALRFALSLSAGVVEEVFFRGFLQPRVGVTISSTLFVLAHLSYDAPLMLVGVTLLSLAFAVLVRWRGNVWPAVVAHAFFDAVQLLWLIPSLAGGAASGTVGFC